MVTVIWSHYSINDWLSRKHLENCKCRGNTNLEIEQSRVQLAKCIQARLSILLSYEARINTILHTNQESSKNTDERKRSIKIRTRILTQKSLRSRMSSKSCSSLICFHWNLRSCDCSIIYEWVKFARYIWSQYIHPVRQQMIHWSTRTTWFLNKLIKIPEI